MLRIARESPTGPDLALLFERHSVDMRADTPPESIHMMDAGALEAPGTAFFVLRDGDRPVGMGAFKRLDETHAEIKSMHVLAEERGRGLSRRLLDHLLREAQAAGIRRLSLETGSHPAFLAARRLYERAGFTQCPPFEGYHEDPNSYFMTRLLD